MAYSDTIQLVQGDTGPTLYFNLKDANTADAGKTLDSSDPTTWAPLDLTGATVRFILREVGSTTVKATIVCSVVTPAAGRVAMAWTGAALDTAGIFEGEIEVTEASGIVQTVHDLIRFRVRAEF